MSGENFRHGAYALPARQADLGPHPQGAAAGELPQAELQDEQRDTSALSARGDPQKRGGQKRRTFGFMVV